MTNWTTIGIVWESSIVREEISKGQHRELGHAEIPTVTDLAIFRANVPEADSIILATLNSGRNSWRVQAQDVARRAFEKGLKPTREELQTLVWNRIKGLRNSPVAAPKTYPLPGGEKYAGSDLTEYRAAYMAALVDLGTPAELAKTIVSNITF